MRKVELVPTQDCEAGYDPGGVTCTFFRDWGKTPDKSDELTMFVNWGNNGSEHFFKRLVQSGFRWQDFAEDFITIWRTSSADTPWKAGNSLSHISVSQKIVQVDWCYQAYLTVFSPSSWRILQKSRSQDLKGALDKFNIIPQLFPTKVGIFIPLVVLAWVMTACRVLRSRLTDFWRYMNISSIFYFSKSTSINTQYSSLWDTLKTKLSHNTS